MKRFPPLLLALALMLAPWPAQASQLVAATGVPPLGHLLGRVGGALVEVQVLCGPGSNPHVFEPTPKQVAGLAQARLYFQVGLPFERALLDKIKAANPGLMVVDLTQGLDMMAEAGEHGHGHAHGHGPAKGKEPAHHHEEKDPHVWLSPRLCQTMARTMAQGLIQADPANAQAYEANLRALLADLQAVDDKLAKALAPLKGREFLVYHPAFGYLGRDYGLGQVAVETGGKEPGPRQLKRLIERARGHGIRVVFVQPQFPVKAAQQVAREIGGVVVPMDDLAPDHLANLERLAQTLSHSLKGANP